MSLGTERRTIEERWLTKWVVDGGADPLTPTQFENVPFEVGDEPNANNGDSWVRLVVRHGEGRQASLGSPGANKFRQGGVVMIQIFSPANKGTKTIRELGDAAVAAFRAVALDDILFQVPSFQLLEPETPWMRALVTAPFYRDENH